MLEFNCKLDEGKFFPFHSCADLGFQRLLEVVATEQKGAVMRVCIRRSDQIHAEDPSDFCKAKGSIEDGRGDYGEFCIPDGKVLGGKQESCALKGFIDHIKIPNSKMEDFDICFKLANEASTQAMRSLHSSTCPAQSSAHVEPCDAACKTASIARKVAIAGAKKVPGVGSVLSNLVGKNSKDTQYSRILHLIHLYLHSRRISLEESRCRT
jgi:hypothetical protein